MRTTRLVSIRQALFAVALLLLAVACDSGKAAIEQDTLDASVDTTGCPRGENPATVGSATLEGRTLTLKMSYPEGCATHTFAVWWSGAAAMSNPPLLPLELHHFVTGATCEGVGDSTVWIDLSGLDGAVALPSNSLRFDLIPAWPVSEPFLETLTYTKDDNAPAAPTGAIGITTDCGGISG